MKIKVCGMRYSSNVAAVAEVYPDYMGFIFYPPSPRDCSGMSTSVVGQLPESVTPVAVTVNMGDDSILALAGRYGFNTVQLHGDETPDQCRGLRERGLTVFKAIGIKDESSLEDALAYEGNVDMFVFDTSSASRGGTGKKFDWDLLGNYKGQTPFLLSGGLGPEDVERVRNLRHEKFVGIDLNSRFETAPALKDAALLKNFFKQIRI